MNLKKLERYLRVNLLGPGPRLIKKNLPGRGRTKVEKHWSRRLADQGNRSYYGATIYSVSRTKQVLHNRPTYVHIFLYSFSKILYNFLAKVKANKYNVFTTDAPRSTYGTFYKKTLPYIFIWSLRKCGNNKWLTTFESTT